jgi:Acyltransferase family
MKSFRRLTVPHQFLIFSSSYVDPEMEQKQQQQERQQKQQQQHVHQPPHQRTKPTPRRHDIAEGLRGVAAVNVVFCHFLLVFMPNVLSRNFPEMLPDPSSPSGDSLAFKIAHSPPVSLLYNGHFAVYVFFVLSGYVLALPWHQQDKKKSPKLSPSEQLLPSHCDDYERLEKGSEEGIEDSENGAGIDGGSETRVVARRIGAGGESDDVEQKSRASCGLGSTSCSSMSPPSLLPSSAETHGRTTRVFCTNPSSSSSSCLLPSSAKTQSRATPVLLSTSSSPAPPPIPAVAQSSSAAARRSTPDEEECTARRVIILRRLWGRFWRLHIPAAASVAFSYALQLVGAYDHRNTTLRPEITSYWSSNFPPSSAPLSRVAAALLGSEVLYGTYELNSVMYELPEKKTLEKKKEKSALEKKSSSLPSPSLSLPPSLFLISPPAADSQLHIKTGGRSCPISGDPSWFYCTSL